MSALNAHIEVISHDGYRGGERPAAVIEDGERLAVLAVEDAWIQTGPEAGAEVLRCFAVRCAGGRRFRLTYSEESGWRGSAY
jgi:hypothetical protein